jgi:hypothetical protein
MFSLQQNCRRGQNRFCLEVRGMGGEQGVRGRGRTGPNNVCTCEQVNKEKKELINSKP